MAYPTVSSAFGFVPINELNGLPYAGATRQIPIPYAYSTSIFNGDLVELAGGAINITGMTASTTSTARAGQIGVFVGCSYTNPSTGQKLFAQYWPASTAANDAVAYVVDDPSAVFKVAMVGQSSSVSNTETTIGYASTGLVGTNVYAITGTAGSSITGNSAMAVSADNPTNGRGNKRVTTALPFRIVSLVPETAYTLTGTGGTSGSSTTLTLAAAVTGLQAGMQIIAPAATAGAFRSGSYNYVTNVNSTTVTLASAITLASGQTVTFVGYPEVLVKWNQGYHSYQFATGV